MRDDCFVSGFFLVVREGFDFLFGIRRRSPLPRRFGKNLDGVAIDLLALKQRLVHATGDGHVGAQQWAAWFRFGFHNVLNGLNVLNHLNESATRPVQAVPVVPNVQAGFGHRTKCLFSTSDSEILPALKSLSWNSRR